MKTRASVRVFFSDQLTANINRCMAVNSKNKGNTFERKISNLLSARFADHLGLESGFRRNIDSGSFFGASNQKRIETHLTEGACFGDIMTPESFKFAIECKHYKTAPSYAAMVKGEYKQLDEWIGQARQDAENASKAMLVIMKFNNVPECAVVEGLDAEAVMFYKGCSIIPLDKWLERPIEYFFA